MTLQPCFNFSLADNSASNEEKTGNLEKVAMVYAKFHQWTGATVLEDSAFAEDFNKATLHSKGMLQIFPREELKCFETINKRVIRFLESHCLKTMGAFITPLDRIDEVRSFVENEIHNYEIAKANLAARYNTLCAEFVSLHPEVAHRQKLWAGDVENRINTTFSVMKLQPLSEKDAQQMEKKIRESITDFLEDIAKAAETVYRNIYKEAEVKSSSLNALLKLQEKMKTFSFMDGRIAPLISMVTSLQGLSAKKVIKDADLTQVLQVLTNLMNQKLTRIQIEEGTSTNDLFMGIEVDESSETTEATLATLESVNEEVSLIQPINQPSETHEEETPCTFVIQKEEAFDPCEGLEFF